MLKLMFNNPGKYLIENYNKYDAIIFPDFTILKNFELFLLKNKIEIIPDNLFTLFTFAQKYIAGNTYLLPRFLERQITHISLEKSGNFFDLKDNEHFITLFLDEYWAIKEHIYSQNNLRGDTKIFNSIDDEIYKYLDRLKNGINYENNIIYFLSKSDLMNLFIENFNYNFNNIIFCCFYYVGPLLNYFIQKNRYKINIHLILEPSEKNAEEYVLKILNPDDISIEDLKIPKFDGVISLPDKRREIKYIANFILEKTHLGFNYSDFVLLFPDIKNYEPIIKEIFDQYGIPYYMETRKKLSEIPITVHIINNLKKVDINTLDDFINFIYNEIKNYFSQNYPITQNERMFINKIEEFKREMKILESINGIEKNYLEYFISFLSTTYYQDPLENINSVTLMNIDHASLKYSKYTILCGFNESEYPRMENTPIIFNDIFKNNIINFRDKKYQEMYETFKLFSIFNYTDNILISYPYLDDEGKRYLESYYIKKIEKYFNLNIERKSYGASSIVYGDILYSKRDMMLINSLKNNIKNNIEPKCESHLENMLKLGLTPTHITVYNTCPRKFYFSYVLGLEIPTKPFSPAYIGNIVHDTLKKFYEQYSDLENVYELLKNNKLRYEIEKILSEINIDKNHKNYLMYLESIKKDIIKAIRQDLYLGTNRKVIEREKEFSYIIDNTIIKGRIDRIDKINDTYILIDYKYSTISHINKLFISNEADIKVSEKDLSMPIYILWLENNYGAHSFVGFYFPLRARFKKNKKWLYLYTKNFRANTSEWSMYVKNNVWNDSFSNSLKNRISEIIKNIKECNFNQIDNLEICNNCEFKNICRGDEL